MFDMQHLDQRERQVIICSASRSRNGAERMKELLNWAISDVYPGKAGVWWELGRRECQCKRHIWEVIWVELGHAGSGFNDHAPQRFFFFCIQLHWRQHQDQKVAALHMTSRKSSWKDLQSLSAFQAMVYGSKTKVFSTWSVSVWHHWTLILIYITH